MVFLKKNMAAIFYIFSVLLIIGCVLQLYQGIIIGIPRAPISSWTAYQWQMFHFYWDSALIGTLITLVIIVLSLKKRYVVFPLSLVFLLHPLKMALFNATQVLTLGFVYPIANIIGILVLLEFLYSIFGTVLWLRNILYHGGKWWH